MEESNVNRLNGIANFGLGEPTDEQLSEVVDEVEEVEEPKKKKK